MSISPDTQSDLCHIVTIRHCFGQGMAFAEQKGLHLVLHQVQRSVVNGDVVEQQDSDPARVGRIFSAHHAHQRGLAQIEAEMPGIIAFVQLGFDVAASRVQRQLIHGQRCFAQHHLHRFFEAFPDHRRAQDVMAFDHRLQCLGEVVETFAAFGPEQCPQYIGVALPGRQVMIENAFLQGRQRVDVLHIASPTRYRVDDSVNRFLAQIGQRQHVGSDAKGRAEPVAAHSSHQRKQFRLVHAQAFKSGTVEPLVVTENHQIVFFLLKTDSVRGKNCHQFAEVHRVTCCLSFRRGSTTLEHGVANSVSHDKNGGASKLEDRAGSGRRYDESRSNKGLRSFDTHTKLPVRRASHTPQKLEHPWATVCRGKLGQDLSVTSTQRYRGVQSDGYGLEGCEPTLRGGLEKGFKVKGNRPTDYRSAGRLPWFQIRRLRLSIGIFVCGTSTRLTCPTEAAT
ncbi:hypothetical protein PssB301D_02654 [Pseudomonas syringae pv. syringae str. B301D-R]|nr:hypothetical protein PssB301D_02654 [Pseudomonas syringae pv. syringae str. B301D-R]